jgi:hypothetical protein
MSRKELETKLQEIIRRKNDCAINWFYVPVHGRTQVFEEVAELRDLEKSIIAILADPLLKEAEIKLIALNRERHMLSVLEDIEYVPLSIEDTEEYKKLSEKYYAFAIRRTKEELNG